MTDRRLTDDALAEIREAVAIVHADRTTQGFRKLMSEYSPKVAGNDDANGDGKNGDGKGKDGKTDPPPTGKKEDPPADPPKRGLWTVGNDDPD